MPLFVGRHRADGLQVDVQLVTTSLWSWKPPDLPFTRPMNRYEKGPSTLSRVLSGARNHPQFFLCFVLPSANTLVRQSLPSPFRERFRSPNAAHTAFPYAGIRCHSLPNFSQASRPRFLSPGAQTPSFLHGRHRHQEHCPLLGESVYFPFFRCVQSEDPSKLCPSRRSYKGSAFWSLLLF